MAESVVNVADVETVQTRTGKTRFVLRDADGNEYTTFREEIGKGAFAAKGRRARISFHEEERRGFTNVYLDAVEVLDEVASESSEGRAVDEVAWKTAVDATPWLVGAEPKEAVDPDELFERLQPFKERVAEDIREEDGPA